LKVRDANAIEAEVERGDFYLHAFSSVRQTAKEIRWPLRVLELWQALRRGIDEEMFLSFHVSLWWCLKGDTEGESATLPEPGPVLGEWFF